MGRLQVSWLPSSQLLPVPSHVYGINGAKPAELLVRVFSTRYGVSMESGFSVCSIRLGNISVTIIKRLYSI